MTKLTPKQNAIIVDVHGYVKKAAKKVKEVDIFAGHVMNVVKFCRELSVHYPSNGFVVVVGGYLHDVHYIRTGNHDTHETKGSKFVKEYLRQFDIPKDEVNLISRCVLNHRGSKQNPRETIEEKIVASADAIDHINRALEMFYRISSRTESYEKAVAFMRAKLQRSYRKIELDLGRELVEEKFQSAKVLFGF